MSRADLGKLCEGTGHGPGCAVWVEAAIWAVHHSSVALLGIGVRRRCDSRELSGTHRGIGDICNGAHSDQERRAELIQVSTHLRAESRETRGHGCAQGSCLVFLAVALPLLVPLVTL